MPEKTETSEDQGEWVLVEPKKKSSKQLKPTTKARNTSQKKKGPLPPKRKKSKTPVVPEAIEKVPSSAVSDYQEFEEFLDAKRSTKSVIMGSSKKNGLKGIWHWDVRENGLSSIYAGRVLCTESNERSDPSWNLNKNRAFWASAMEMKREFVLATNIIYYQTANIQHKYTIHEVLWLIDNGYTASVSKENPDFTVFSPPAIAAEIKLIHYEHMKPYSGHYRAVQQQFRSVITAIIAEREVLLSKKQEILPVDIDDDQNKSDAQIYQSLNDENQSPCFFANADVDAVDDDSHLSDADDNSDASDSEIEQQHNQNEDGWWWVPSSCTIL